MERVTDVELFLGIQDNWAKDSSHHLVVLYEMFRHAAYRRAERGGTNHPLRPSAEHASAEPGGGHTHYSAGRAGNNQGGTARDIFRSIQNYIGYLDPLLESQQSSKR